MATVQVQVPSFLTKFSTKFFIRLAIEVAQSTAVAGAVGGLTLLANDAPMIGDHFGLSPLVTTQLAGAILYARAAVSGLNSVKQGTVATTPPTSV